MVSTLGALKVVALDVLFRRDFRREMLLLAVLFRRACRLGLSGSPAT